MAMVACDHVISALVSSRR